MYTGKIMLLCLARIQIHDSEAVATLISRSPRIIEAIVNSVPSLEATVFVSRGQTLEYRSLVPSPSYARA